MTLPIPGFIRGMKLTHMIGLTVSLGILVGLGVGLFFAQNEIRRELRTIQEMENAVKLVNLSTTLSSYIHEQQKERGATAVFITSEGRTFRAELTAQRKLTDEKRAVVRDTYQQALGLADGELTEKIRIVSDKMSRLDKLRSRVDSLRISRPEAIAEYTSINTDLIDIIGGFAHHLEDPQLSKDILLFSSFLAGKDHSGIERALGASGFAVGEFTEGHKQLLIERIVAQDALLDFYASQTEPSYAQAYEQILQSPSSKEVARLRQVALSGSPEEIARTSAKQWFDIITKKINLLKAHETKIADKLVAMSQKNSASAWSAIVRVAVITAIGLAIALLMSLYFMRAIATIFRSVLSPLEKLAQGDLDINLPPETKNEFGQVVGALKVFRQTAYARQKEEQEREIVLDKLALGLGRLSDGDFTRKIVNPFPPEYERLRTDFNRSLVSISHTLEEIVSCIYGLLDRAGTLSVAAGKLASRTNSQMQSLQEAASAMEELTASVASASKNATETAQFVKTFDRDTSSSVTIVGEAVTTMKEIESSSAEISNIVSMIEEIAFQTNLLALNAGVEAARAGDSGRGFAVVASEVRALAVRSSEAAKDITTLIKGNNEKVVEGVGLIEGVSNALSNMVDQTRQITENISSIAVSSQEQSTGLTEVNTAVNELDRVTQKNSDMVEDTKSTSAGIENDAARLSKLVASFKFGKDDAPAEFVDVEPERKIA